jgi:hypothetical protein
MDETENPGWRGRFVTSDSSRRWPTPAWPGRPKPSGAAPGRPNCRAPHPGIVWFVDATNDIAEFFTTRRATR